MCVLDAQKFKVVNRTEFMAFGDFFNGLWSLGKFVTLTLKIHMYIGVAVCMCIKQTNPQTTLLFIQDMIKYK